MCDIMHENERKYKNYVKIFEIIKVENKMDSISICVGHWVGTVVTAIILLLLLTSYSYSLF